MIERSRQPGGGIVTCSAKSTELAIMRVVFRMAGVTVSLNGDEFIVQVADRTIQVGMGTRQRKFRLGVIKSCRDPSGSRVASTTDESELPLVGVILGVAGVAVLRGRF